MRGGGGYGGGGAGVSSSTGQQGEATHYRYIQTSRQGRKDRKEMEIPHLHLYSFQEMAHVSAVPSGLPPPPGL